MESALGEQTLHLLMIFEMGGGGGQRAMMCCMEITYGFLGWPLGFNFKTIIHLLAMEYGLLI